MKCLEVLMAAKTHNKASLFRDNNTVCMDDS